jgi:hypothetical protein
MCQWRKYSTGWAFNKNYQHCRSNPDAIVNTIRILVITRNSSVYTLNFRKPSTKLCSFKSIIREKSYLNQHEYLLLDVKKANLDFRTQTVQIRNTDYSTESAWRILEYSTINFAFFYSTFIGGTVKMFCCRSWRNSWRLSIRRNSS